MTNREIRRWYRRQIAEGKDEDRKLKSQGATAEQRARRAFQIRQQARLEARQMMADRREVELLQQRDKRKYGARDGPTFDTLLDRAHQEGFRGDEAYEYIILKAWQINEKVQGQS